MRIDSSGNVGIGTTSPTAYSAGDRLLQVHAAVNGSELKLTNATTGTGATAGFVAIQSGNDTYLWNGSNSFMSFGTNNTERMRIDSSGNVGIGTSSPQFRLDISGTNARIRLNETTGFVLTSYVNTGGTFDIGRDNSTGTVSGAAYAGFLNVGGAYPLIFNTNSAERMRITSGGDVGIGTSSPAQKLDVNGDITFGSSNKFTSSSNVLDGAAGQNGARLRSAVSTSANPTFSNVDDTNTGIFFPAGDIIAVSTAAIERMRIDSNGDVLIGNTSTAATLTSTSTIAGIGFNKVGYGAFSRDQGSGLYVNRLTNDGNLVEFIQAGALEGTISVSGTTVSYNGGHLSRWSQLYNETTKVAVYRGSVLESVDAMCEWEKDGQPLPNEQATKTIVSTTVASKAVAGVFDRYDEDDEDNPYDFYVAQSGDFVIRIAQGVTVQNGDLLESAGDGTARPQADDICRSSTIAKVTSNYVSVTYEDGSYCVPCILMIG
jgi:hypothetical protein